MKRDIIRIDESKCDGCGLCVTACAEGAIQIIDGVAKLVSEVYCDGLGACLSDCPTGALTIEAREAQEFDEEATQVYLEGLKEREETKKITVEPKHHGHSHGHGHFAGCPGSALRSFDRSEENDAPAGPAVAMNSQLNHWPVQLMLVPPAAPFLQGADLLICADCVPFALPDFHSRYLKGRVVLVGCPKLDDLSYYQNKLKEIFSAARPKRITVLKMEVPCCSGIEYATLDARDQVDPEIPMEVHTIGVRGDVLEPVEKKSVSSYNQALQGEVR